MTLSSRAMKPLGNALLMYVSSLAGAGFFLGDAIDAAAQQEPQHRREDTQQLPETVAE